MKFAQFLPHYPQPGGTTKAVEGLSSGFRQCGHEVVIQCYGETERNSFVDGVAVMQVCSDFTSALLPAAGLRKHMSESRSHYDVVLLHGMFNPQVLGMAMFLVHHNIPYVVCPHDPYHPALLEKHRLRKRVYRPFEVELLDQSVAVHVLSRRHIVHLRRFGSTAPVIVSPNGFDPMDLALSVGRRYSRKGVRMLYLGRLDLHHKGLDILLKGVAKLGLSERKMFKLTLMGPDIGDGKTLEDLVVSLKIENLVTFRPPDFDRTPGEIISGYDWLVLPSRFDGFGLSALEAMIVGTPVLVSGEAGIAEHVEKSEGGMIVGPDPEAIATGIRTIINCRSQWEEFGVRGRDYAVKYLTWKASAGQFLRDLRKFMKA